MRAHVRKTKPAMQVFSHRRLQIVSNRDNPYWMSIEICCKGKHYFSNLQAFHKEFFKFNTILTFALPYVK